MKLFPLLTGLDLAIVGGFLVSVVVIAAFAAKRASKSAEDFFLSGRSMPWWLLGVSMVACTFSCDTPNLATNIIRQQGISGYWVVWAFVPTGMLTVFVYAKLWRRSRLATDLGFYEIRYSGKPAQVLRGFRAVYLGLFFNVIVMATVSLAAVKIGASIFGLSPLVTLVISFSIVGVYAMLGGLTGSIWADFYQYSLAMFGAVAAAYFAVKTSGDGTLAGLLAHPAVAGKISFLPAMSGAGWKSNLMTVMVLPLAVQWWSTWYPGSEPGGGGYIAQRMLSAKDEKNAVGATLLFSFLNVVIRVWPWAIVALASLVAFPDLAAIQSAFPAADAQFVGHDMAYPAMIARLPSGWLGLVAASLVAAFMSTIATHLNWGSSYLVTDFYLRFFDPSASPRRQVFMGRIAMLLLIVCTAAMTFALQNAKGAFDLILQIGAGTGLLYILRWFWWRLNSWSEISAMAISFAAACFFKWGAPACGLEGFFTSGWRAEWFTWTAWKLLLGVAVTTAGWLAITFLTPPEDPATLEAFARKIGAGGPGWRKVVSRVPDLAAEDASKPWDLPMCLLCMALGCLFIWSSLFGIGYLVYGFGGVARGYTVGGAFLAVAALALTGIFKCIRRIRFV